MSISTNTYVMLLLLRKLSLFFLACVISITVCAQKEIELWYKSPASEWTEALPIGNGRLGAMVFGHYQREQIQLNEESIWGGSKINNNNPEARANLSEIQQAVFNGKYHEVWEMSDKYLLGTPPEIRSYQPLGNLCIQYSWNKQPSDYRRSLQLNTGIARTEYSIDGNKVVQEVFASSPQDVIVVSIRADRVFNTELILSRDRGVDTYNEEDGLVWFSGQIHDEDSQKKGPGGQHIRFSSAMKIIFSDGAVSHVLTDSSAGYKITAAKRVTVILTAASDYNLKILDYDRSIDPLESCKKILNVASKMTGARLMTIHKQDHRSFFDRVNFVMGKSNQNTLPTNERLERVKAGAIDPGLIVIYYQYGRYLLMGSSRKPGTLPANLQGIWNKEYTAKWNSDFHTNINLQMNYWPAETGNLSETSELLAEFVRLLTVPGGVTAREMYGTDGWTLHHLTDIFGRTGVADGVWGFSPMAGPWMTFPVYRRYEFTGDTSYLRELAYPIIKGSVKFVLGFLIDSPEGYLVTNPSISPENPFYISGTSGKEKAYLSYATTIDIQIIQALFNNYIQAAAILGVDKELVDKVKEARKKLPPMKVGANGTLQEWIQDYEEVEPGHRHISHLLGLYPLDLISPENPILFEAARKTIERRLANSERHVGWSSAWIINFYARLLDSDKAGEQVQRLLQYSTLNNLLNTIPPFQIDGNFGGTAGIAEMLLQSQNRVIHLLPALPDTWPDGKIEGLRARGGYTVDMEWKHRKLTRLVIRANKEGTYMIRYHHKVIQVSLKKGANILSTINNIVD